MAEVTGHQIPDVKFRWTPIVVFYALACLWSWPFFYWRDLHPESWKALQLPGFLKTWLIMWGPGLSAILCYRLFKDHKKLVSFLGSKPGLSLLFYLAPVLAISYFDAMSIPESLVLALIGLVSTLGEELGWRSYLTNSLQGKKPWLRYLLIGVMWEFWHFTNRTHHGTLREVLVRLSFSYPIVVILSALIGMATERTKSLLVAVSLHLAVNMALGEEFENGLTAVLVVSPMWIFLLIFWNRKSSRSH